jgi:hypothetical protein
MRRKAQGKMERGSELKDFALNLVPLTTRSIKLFTWNVKYTRVMGLF